VNNTKKASSKPGRLRRFAREAGGGSPDETTGFSHEDLATLVHELSVYQAELLRVQTRLEQARSGYEDLYEFAPVGYFTVDRGGIVRGANETGREMLGVERERLVGRVFTRFVAEESAGVYQRHLANVFGGSSAPSCEIRLVPARGPQFDGRLESVTAIDPQGNQLCRSALSDVTLQKRAETALRRARDEAEATRQVLELANQAAEIEVWVWDIRSGEPGAKRHHGVGPEPSTTEEVGYLGFLASVHPDDRDRVRQALQRALGNCGDYEVEYRVEVPSGETQWIEARGRVVRSSSGQPTQMIGIAMNTTRRKATEAALARAEAAEVAVQARSEFMALASHELHTPLNAVLGYTQLVLDEVDGPLNPEQRRSLERVASNAHALKDIADAILELSRLRAGEIALDAKVFCIRAALSDGLQDLSDRARRKGLAFTLTVGAGVPDELRGDPVRLLQAVEILADNAVKFTTSGRIEIMVTSLTSHGDRARLNFSVRDTGGGIEVDQQSRIFQAFQQVEPTATRSHGGIGLGLALCTALVKELGGEISVESEPGRGSRFSFTACFDRAGGV
jgi:PAS domain S-box-containing protein